MFQKYLLQYTIEGRGKQSIETYDPVLNLSSLSAGNYSIWVSCNTKNGNRTPSKQLIHIIVTPPWYKTVWFIGVAAVLFIIMTASIGYIHYRRKERNMKGNVNYFLQAVLNDMLSSKEEKNSEVKKITVQKLLCLISHQKRMIADWRKLGNKLKRKTARKMKNFSINSICLSMRTWRVENFLLNS